MNASTRNQSRVTTELRSVTRTRRTLDGMLWVIVLGTIFYSLMTSTPLVAAHSKWPWSGWALGVLVDAAFVLSISADSALSRHGLKGGRWPAAFRWATGTASLFLNVWASIQARDWVGVGIHSIPPVILVCAAEVAPIYRRKFRDLETLLNEQVTEERVTRAVTSRRGNGARPQEQPVTRNQEQPVTEQDTQPVTGTVTPTKQAIRDAFLQGLTPTQAAEQVGTSRSYVSKQYKLIKTELERAA